MRHFLITAAAMTAFVASLASVPANALENYGPQQISGQCFKANNGRDSSFGYWSTCPQTASVAITHATTKRHHR
jgi:hypothetical protein